MKLNLLVRGFFFFFFFFSSFLCSHASSSLVHGSTPTPKNADSGLLKQQHGSNMTVGLFEDHGQRRYEEKKISNFNRRKGGKGGSVGGGGAGGINQRPTKTYRRSDASTILRSPSIMSAGLKQVSISLLLVVFYLFF